MYYPTKTSEFVSLISAGAIALGSVTVAFAHISRFEDLSTADSMPRQHVSDEFSINANERPTLTTRVPGRTERRESWDTPLDSTSSGHPRSHLGMFVRSDEKGRSGSDDYDVSRDRANASGGSIDSSTSGDSISNQGMRDGRGLPKDDPAYASPRSDFHAGPHRDQ